MYKVKKGIRKVGATSHFMSRSSRPEVFYKINVYKNFLKSTGKHLFQSIFLNKFAGHTCKFKKETLAQLFSCEFCKIFKNTLQITSKGYYCVWLTLVSGKYEKWSYIWDM